LIETTVIIFIDSLHVNHILTRTPMLFFTASLDFYDLVGWLIS